ncbi:radical SAM protein [Oceanispirochaeta sp.]|jgi:radical SAM superfamily enzyme YgiQ (UPF0313 family)|uniref:B12-binding domain-containing radical SAM protein n=1 Tax=Oceanispirochaeta sp. TaxID=2035350 RepID=UPI00261AD675|nr:radical SAM protein [Oceanispirochaeta sp.]MDA3956124.1 radical SAM protein [Oceanispirochaeta sp.]
MKLILATIHLESSTRAIPLAAACLKAEVINHDVLLKNYTLEQSAEEISDDLLGDAPDVLGFPVYLWNRSLVLSVIKILKKTRPDLPLLAGGPEVTAAPESFLRESGISGVMQGEGEVLINPVLDALSQGRPLPEIPGLWTASYSPVSPGYCSDINALASPILSGALDLNENKGLLWELSRGCPFACEFCFESKGSGKVRTFALDRIRKELEMIRDSGIEQVFVLDPTFNVNKKRVLILLEWLREMTPETYYYFEIRTEFLDEETAFAFTRIPCTLQIGLQSSDPAVLKNINREFDPDAFRSKVSLLGDAGVSFGLDLIYGLPGDSLEGFRNSLDYALSLEPNHLDLFPLAVLPGTVLYDRRETLQMKADIWDPYLVRETGSFSQNDLEKARLLSLQCDLLYNQGRGISWFSRVCYDLELTPVQIIESSAIISEFQADSLGKTPLDFLKVLYSDHGKEGLFPVIQDLFNYLDLLEELEQIESSFFVKEEIKLSPENLLTLHSSVRFHCFHIPPDLILDGFPASSEELMHEAGKFQVLLWGRDHQICMDILESEELKILKKLQGNDLKYSEIVTGLNTSELDDFVINGIQEAYISRV